MDLKEVKKNASTFFQSAQRSARESYSKVTANGKEFSAKVTANGKELSAKVTANGKEFSASVLEQLKSKASEAAAGARTYAQEAGIVSSSSANSASDAAAASGSSSKASKRRSSMKSAAAENAAVERLCALGFSVAAVRHALRQNGGRVEDAGVWLLDEANRDEILAVETDAHTAEPLVEGCLARINGLRGAAHLNGTFVTVRQWDDESQRWVVEHADGSIKAIRPRNLDKAAASEGREDLLKQVYQLIGDGSDHEVSMYLNTLSEKELLEVLRGLNVEKQQASTESQTKTKLGSSHSVIPAAHTVGVPPSVAEAPEPSGSAVGAAEVEYEALKEQLQAKADAIKAEENRQELKATALEAREAELLENQARWRSEFEEASQRIRLLEAMEAARAEQQAASEQHHVSEDKPEHPDSSAASDAVEKKQLEERRAELEELHAKALEAARELEAKQAAAKLDAENRELRLLEAEEEQRRIEDQLVEEQGRLEQERRKVQLLQRSLIVTASSATPTGSNTESAPVEVALDAGDGEEVPFAKRPSRRSLSSKQARPDVSNIPDDTNTEEKLEPREVSETDGPNTNDGPLREGDESAEVESEDRDSENQDDDQDEEVWELDWSALNSPNVAKEEVAEGAAQAPHTEDSDIAQQSFAPPPRSSGGATNTATAAMDSADGAAA